MRPPPSLHLERLREAPPGYVFDVITRGFGAMFDFADRIEARDRWRIMAYVRALQLASHATIDDVPSAERARLRRPSERPARGASSACSARPWSSAPPPGR